MGGCAGDGRVARDLELFGLGLEERVEGMVKMSRSCYWMAIRILRSRSCRIVSASDKEISR